MALDLGSLRMARLSRLAHVRLALAPALVALGAVGVLPDAQARQGSSTRPNFVVVLVDDAGYADFGFQGGGIAGDFADLTPRIDALVGGGVRFSNGYASSAVCGPSRAGLLTGRYQGRYGFETNIQTPSDCPGLSTSESTVADLLRADGYRTYMLGKWHLGVDPEFHPNVRGFDEFFGFLSGGRTYFQLVGGGPNSRLQRNGTPVVETPDQYVTDLLGAEAEAYVDGHVASFPGQPFFVYLSFNAVHTPLEADDPRLADPRISGIVDANRRTLGAMTIALDDAVGGVLDALDRNGVASDTIVAFVNDNGGPEDDLGLLAPNWSDNGPLRGNKSRLYEGGIRIPFAIRWPAGVAPALVGTTLDDVVSTLDLLPTFAAAAGIDATGGAELDGVDLTPRLTGASATPLARRLVWRTAGAETGTSAIRLGDWKMVRDNVSGTVELFDLAADLSEANDLAQSRPARVALLEHALADAEDDLIEPLWAGAALTKSVLELEVCHAPIEVELRMPVPGFARAYDDVRVPIGNDRDWVLECTLERFGGAGGATANAFVTIGGDASPAGTIGLGAFFDQSRLEVRELGTGAVSQTAGVAFPATGEVPIRIRYDAAESTLTLRWGTESVVHVLSPTWTAAYPSVTHLGHAVVATDARFSPIRRIEDRSAPLDERSWSTSRMARDYAPGDFDVNGRFLGGTEAISFVVHQGAIYAGVGYWNDVFFGAGSPDPHPGAQILVKASADAPWREEVSFGADHLRIEAMRSVVLTTDRFGSALDPPVELLLAGSGELPTVGPLRRPVVWMRAGGAGPWTATYPAAPAPGSRTTRSLADHVDRITGVHSVFVGFGSASSELVRGGYDAGTGLIVWEPTPELVGTERILSAGALNGALYACVGSNGIDGDDVGGIFWREDGPSPTWHFVHEFPVGPANHDIRGFTAVPHPSGFDHDVALVTVESERRIFTIDPIGGSPRNGHRVTVELDLPQFLGDVWAGGAPLEGPALSAYNDMPRLVDEQKRRVVHLIGLGVRHPAGPGTVEGEAAHLLVRHLDGRYEVGSVIDPSEPFPNPGADGLRATRALVLSPFPEEEGRVLYLGGFDAFSQTGPVYHDTAWIYRAGIPLADRDAPAAR